VTAAGVSLSWQNVETVTVSSIPMGVELLFSRSPFEQQVGRRFAFTKPASSQALRLPAGRTRVTVPDELLKKNMLVEVSTAGKTKVAPYPVGEMVVKLTENCGQLRVTYLRPRAVSGPIARTSVVSRFEHPSRSRPDPQACLV
jgi:hypothetical protein